MKFHKFPHGNGARMHARFAACKLLAVVQFGAALLRGPAFHSAVKPICQIPLCRGVQGMVKNVKDGGQAAFFADMQAIFNGEGALVIFKRNAGQHVRRQGQQIFCQPREGGGPVAITPAEVQHYTGAAVRPQRVKKVGMKYKIGNCVFHHLLPGGVQHRVLTGMHGNPDASLLQHAAQRLKFFVQPGTPVKYVLRVRGQRDDVRAYAHQGDAHRGAVAQHGFQRAQVVTAHGEHVFGRGPGKGKSAQVCAGHPDGLAGKSITYHGHTVADLHWAARGCQSSPKKSASEPTKALARFFCLLQWSHCQNKMIFVILF